MTTPLIILSLLIVPFLTVRCSHRFAQWPRDSNFGGVLGLSLAFVFFGVGHFAMTAEMVEMLPPLIPARASIVYATGALEWMLAISLLYSRYRRAAGWVCIGVLVGFFPVNVYAALKGIGMGGHQWGPIYLLIRGPLQLFLIVWTYWFVVRSAKV